MEKYKVNGNAWELESAWTWGQRRLPGRETFKMNTDMSWSDPG